MSKINKQIRKKHPSKVKFQVALEALKETKTQTEVARSYGVHSNLISRWKDQLAENGHRIFEQDNSGRSGKEQNRKIEELEQIIGKQAVEIALLKKFLGHYRSD